MEFGRVNDLSQVDFTMPPDHPGTLRVLKQSQVVKHPGIYVGCAKWGRKDWIGKIYPEGTKEKDFLSHYGKHFNSIELNATFHRMPPKAIIKGWAERGGGNLLFCPKFPKIISQEKGLKDAGELTRIFADAISEFGNNLGPCFLQVPPFFTVKQTTVLKNYIQQLEGFPAPVFIEFRHPDWFRPSSEAEEVFQFMEEHRIGTVITDTAGRRDCLHQRLTTPHAFIRFVGNRLHPTDFSRIHDWSEKLDDWLKKGLQTACFFIHNDADAGEAFSPELSAYTVEQFNQGLKLDLPRPNLIHKQEKLF